MIAESDPTAECLALSSNLPPTLMNCLTEELDGAFSLNEEPGPLHEKMSLVLFTFNSIRSPIIRRGQPLIDVRTVFWKEGISQIAEGGCNDRKRSSHA